MSQRYRLKILSREILQPTFNSILAAISLTTGFVLVRYFYLWQEYSLFWGTPEIVYSTLSLVCCYLFITVLTKRAAPADDLSFEFNIWILAKSYLLFTAVMFFMTSFFEARFAVLAGFAINASLIHLGLKYLFSRLKLTATEPTEGTKKLIIKGMPVEDTKTAVRENTRVAVLFSDGESKAQPTDLNLDVYADKSGLVEDYNGDRNLIKFGRIRKSETVFSDKKQ